MTRARIDAAQTDDAVKRRGYHPVRQLAARPIDLRLRAGLERQQHLERGLGLDVLAPERIGAIDRELGLLELGLRLHQIGLLDIIVEPDQGLALLDPLAAGEIDLGNASRGHGHDLDRLPRPGRAHRLDAASHGLLAGHHRLDLERRRALLPASRILWLPRHQIVLITVITASQDRGQQQHGGDLACDSHGSLAPSQASCSL